MPPPPSSCLEQPLIVGLITNPERLIQIRRNRLLLLNQDTETRLYRHGGGQCEIQDARRLYARRQWLAAIDVTRRSIEETAAAILQMLATRREQRLQAGPVTSTRERP